MNRLDNHIIENILLQSSPPDILSCSAVCHRFNQIISESAATQLILHQHIYASSDRYQPRDGTCRSVKEELLRLIRREKRFRDFTPRYSTLQLDRDQTMIAAYGDAIVTRGYHRNSSVPDEKGLYLAYTLWTFKVEKGEWINRKIKVDIPPDLRGSYIDIEKDIMIIKESHGDVSFFNYHMYHIFNENKKRGEQLQAYPVDVLTIESQQQHVLFGFLPSPTLFLGPNDTFQIKQGDLYSFYKYKVGLSDHASHPQVLQSPSGSFDPDCIFIGNHLLGQTHVHSDSFHQYLLIYRKKDLPSSPTDIPALPVLALSLPSEHASLSMHIQNQMRLSASGQLRLGHVAMIGSADPDGVIHLSFYVPNDRPSHHNGPGVVLEQTPCDNNLVIRIPVKEIWKMSERLRDARRPELKRPNNDAEFQILFPGVPIIHPENWIKNAFMSLESEHPDRDDTLCVGAKVFAYKQPEKTKDVKWRNQPKEIELNMYDFNQRATKLEDRLGITIGGLGKPIEARIDEPINATENVGPIDREKTKRTIIQASNDSLGCVKHDITYTSCGDFIDSIHFDGNKLFVAHENSVADILDFDD